MNGNQYELSSQAKGRVHQQSADGLVRALISRFSRSGEKHADEAVRAPLWNYHESALD